MTKTGGCQCGALRYEVTGAPLGLYVCHCLECRRQSASAFGISLEVPAGSVTVTQGTPATWTRDTDSGRRLDCLFCPDCGSRVMHVMPGGATLTIKGGSLDEPPDLSRAVHIWTKRKLPGVVIPEGAEQHPEEPPD